MKFRDVHKSVPSDFLEAETHSVLKSHNMKVNKRFQSPKGPVTLYTYDSYHDLNGLEHKMQALGWDKTNNRHEYYHPNGSSFFALGRTAHLRINS